MALGPVCDMADSRAADRPAAMADISAVHAKFTTQWTGPINEIFSRHPIPAFVSEIKDMMQFKGPITPPLSKTPLAFAQHKMLQPGDANKIVAERASCHKHIIDSISKQYPHELQENVESADLVAAIDYVASHLQDPGKLVKNRKRIMGRLKSMQDVLVSHEADLKRLQPPTVAELSKTFPMSICMIYILNEAMDSPDKYLPHSFVTGFPMEGHLHTTGWYRAGNHPRTNWDESFEDWNHALIRSIRRRAMKFKENEAAVKECYDATLSESKNGYLSGPFTYQQVCDALPGRNIRALRRFPQFRYPGAPVRPCDHGGENDINESFSTQEKLITENSEFPLRSAIMYRQKLAQPVQFRISTNDLKKAYRQMPSGHPESTVVALWNPDAKRVEFFIVLGMPFGLAASVLQFNRPMEMVVAALRRLFGVPCAHYYDDLVNAGPAYSSKSDDDTTRALCFLLGFVLDDGKWCKPLAVNAFLGVLYDFSQFPKGEVRIRIKEGRKLKIAAMLQHALDSGRMTSADAASLRGKLYFACTQAFGRVGRAALQSFVARQYSYESNLDDSLLTAIAFFQQFIEHADAIPRTYYIDASTAPPLFLWTDASWENDSGHMGIILYIPEVQRFFYAHAEVPLWMKNKWVPSMQKIGQAEILAAIIPYLSLPPSLLFRRNVIHFVDNTSAINALLNGYSKAPDSAWMVNIFHTANARIQANPWWEHVDSKANCADMPSRMDFEYVKSVLRAVEFPIVLDEYAWSRPAFQWFY